MIKIQRYSTDYTFGKDGLKKEASVAEDIARKEPSLSNDNEDQSAPSVEAPTDGAWIRVQDPDDIDANGFLSLGGYGAQDEVFRRKKMRFQILGEERSRGPELVWTNSGRRISKGDIIILDSGEVHFADTQPEPRPAGGLIFRPIEDVKELSPPRLAVKARRWGFAANISKLLTATWKNAIANGESDHVGASNPPPPTTEEGPTAEQKPAENPGAKEGEGREETISYKPAPKNIEGEVPPEWKDSDYDWFKLNWLVTDGEGMFVVDKDDHPTVNLNIQPDLDETLGRRPGFLRPNKRDEWDRKKRIWDFLWMRETPTPAATPAATPADTPADTPVTKWNGNEYTFKGEIKADGPDKDWLEYIEKTSKNLVDAGFEGDATASATDVWKAWIERGLHLGEDTSRQAFYDWYHSKHEAAKEGEQPTKYSGTRRADGSYDKTRRQMWVNEAPPLIRAEYQTSDDAEESEALDGHLESEAYDVDMEYSVEKRSQIALDLVKLSNHLDSINEFDLSDSLDEVISSILR